MSFAVEKEAWTLIESATFDLTDSDKLVLVKAAFWANGDSECWHGIQGFVDAGVASRTQVIRSLKKLARLGVLSKRPRQKPEGRGRATDVIVVHPAAKCQTHALFIDDQSAILDAAESQSDPQQSANGGGGTNKGLERPLERPLENGAGSTRDRRRKLPKVGRHPVTEAEWDQAVAILDRFNARNGSKLHLLGTTGEPTDSMTRIVMRTRQHPELETEDYLLIVDRNFDNPWWSEPKLGDVGAIFGPGAWPRASANDGIRRNKSGRKVRLDIDRVPNSDEYEPF